MVWKYAGRYVLPFSPSSMKMSIRWNTALTDTISSVNTRSLSKEYPQFTVNYSALLKGAGLQFATDRVLRDLGQEVLVPMWQDVATERISDTEVAISTTDKTFYKEGLQVMLWASDTEWQIVDVEQVNPSYIKFGVNSTDWKCVVPIEEGFIASSPTTSTDRNRNTKLNYVVTIKRLDGPLSSIGGGVIPGVYVNTFETLQTDFGSVIHSPNDSFLLIDKYVGANIKYRNDAIDSSNSMIYLGGDVTNRALHIFRRNLPNDELEMFMDVGGVRKQIRSNVTFASLFPIGITKSVHASLDITNPLGLPRLYIDGVEFTDFYILINDSISSFSAVDFSYRGGATFSNGSTAYDYYWSTDSNFSSPSSIAQYAQAPNALVNNRPFYTGRELFTQVAPDVVPYSVKSFKGNGVDSYIDKSNIGASSDVFSTSFIIKHEQMTTDGFIAVVQGADTDEAYYLVGMQTNNKLIVYSYNTIFQKAFETTNAFIVGEVYEILVKLDLAFGGFKVYVNDVLQTIAETFDGLPSVANPTSLVLTLGSFNQGVRNFYKGQIAELYWGDNPLIVNSATMEQYKDGQEHFEIEAPYSFYADNATSIKLSIDVPVVIDKFIGFSVYRHIKNHDLYNNIMWISDSTNNTRFLEIHINGLPSKTIWATCVINGIYHKTVGTTASADTYIQLGEWNHFFAYLDVTTDSMALPKLWINGVEVIFNVVNTNLPLNSIAGTAPNCSGTITNGDSGADLYVSTDVNFKNQLASYSIDPDSVGSNRPFYTYKELCSGVGSDTPSIDWTSGTIQHQYKKWFGGAIQGTVEEGWEGGAVQGIVEVSPPIPAPLGPYPEDPKLTEVPIQSSKGNNYSLHINTVKSVGGVIKVNSTRSVPTVTTTHSWDNQSRAEYLDMLDFAAQCRGRKNAFDAASFKSDIIPLNEGTISDGYLDVLDPGLQSLNLVGTRFTVIRGRSWDSSEVYEVLSLENVTGGVRLVLDKAIIATIFTTDTVSNVRQSRLNSDVLEINIDSFNRSSASISVRDINEGG